MKILGYICIGLVSFWLQLTLAQWIALGSSFKPNFPLLTTLLLSLSGIGAAIFPYAAIMGLAQDAVSHTMLGTYGLSFTLTAFVVRGFVEYLHSHQSFFLMVTVLLFALLENFLAWVILQFYPQRPFFASWLLAGIQMSCYTALLSVFVNRILSKAIRSSLAK